MDTLNYKKTSLEDSLDLVLSPDAFLRLVVSGCLSLMISSVLFFLLSATGEGHVQKKKAKQKGMSDDEMINFSFYIMSSLLIALLITFYFLPWLNVVEMAYLSTVIFVYILTLSRLLAIVPLSFTLGEAACFLVLCCGALFLHHFKVAFVNSQHLSSIPEIIAFMEVAMASCLLMVFILYMVSAMRCTLGFYFILFSVMLGFSLPLLYLCLKQDFVLWLISYIKQNNTKTSLFSYWAACLLGAAGLVLINTRRLSSTQSSITTSARKQFHIFAIAVIVPGLVTDVEITCLALTCALIVFIMIETMRILNIPPCGQSIGQHLLMFVDQQDQGLLILTPIYLLCGCAAPLWLFPHDKGAHISLFSGILSLGVGDTVAAVVGSKAGSIPWFESKKTVEGTIANILSQIMALYFLNSYDACHGIVWSAAFLAITVASLIEALTSQIDNLVLPLITYLLLVAL